MRRMLILMAFIIMWSDNYAYAASFSGGRSGGFSSSSSRSYSSPSSSKSAPATKSSSGWSGSSSSSGTKAASASAGAADKTKFTKTTQSRAAYDSWQRSQRQFKVQAKPVSQATARAYIPPNYRYNPERRALHTQSYYTSRNFTPPPYAYSMSPSFGGFDTLFLFMALDNMQDASLARTMAANQNTPDMKEWRAAAEKEAQTNAELKAKLDAMDAKIAAMDKTGLKEGIPDDLKEVATSEAVLKTAPPEEESHWVLWTLGGLLTVAGGVYLIFVRRW